MVCIRRVYRARRQCSARAVGEQIAKVVIEIEGGSNRREKQYDKDYQDRGFWVAASGMERACSQNSMAGKVARGDRGVPITGAVCHFIELGGFGGAFL